jgi:hypothetical protein
LILFFFLYTIHGDEIPCVICLFLDEQLIFTYQESRYLSIYFSMLNCIFTIFLARKLSYNNDTNAVSLKKSVTRETL